MNSVVSDFDTFEISSDQYRLEAQQELAKSEFAVAMSRTRNQLNLTQQELAAKLGVSQAYVAGLESGNANPTLACVARIFAAMGHRLAPVPSHLGTAAMASSLERALSNAEKSLGKIHPIAIAFRNDLSQVHIADGNFEEAQRLLEILEAISLSFLGMHSS